MRQEQEALSITDKSDLSGPDEMRKVILLLRKENIRLQEETKLPLKETPTSSATEQLIAALNERINLLTADKERLHNALQSVKESSFVVGHNAHEKHLYLVKKEKEVIMRENEELKQRIAELQRELLTKNFS